MFNFLKNSKKFHCLKKENLSPSLLGEKEAMKTADMISVHEFTFRTEKNPSFPPVHFCQYSTQGGPAAVRSAVQGLAQLPILGTWPSLQTRCHP